MKTDNKKSDSQAVTTYVISYAHHLAMEIVKDDLISYNTKFGAFIIKPSDEKESIVKLLPKAKCLC